MSSKHAVKSPIACLVAALAAVLLCACPRKPDPAASAAADKQVRPLEVISWTGKPDEKRWKEFDKLVAEQKYKQAAKLIKQRLQESRAKKRSEQWARALIRYVKLQTALHGYEKAVRWLKDQPWPKDLLGHTVVHLYYASTLVHYARVYSWEIRKRERVASKGHVDLKTWTLDQIYAEAQRAYEAVWRHRGQLGEHPVKLLAEHLQLNDYPRKIRATQRDAVSYLRVQLLDDSSGWRPEHENEVYQLDLPLLLGNAKSPKQPLDRVSLADPDIHPLLKTCAVLDDLERWHAGRGEHEAAFEARLKRLRTLHARLTQAPDRAQIRRDLRDRLPKIKQLPWWSMGMSVLAEHVRAERAHDRLIRAREIARRGQRAFPDSVGGRRCAHIIKSIEAPAYQLQGMATDGPQKRSIGVRYKNLRKLYFRAYPIDLRQTIARSKDYSLLPRYRALEKLVEKNDPSHRWQVELEPTVDFDMHRADVTPPMRGPGYYVVVASAREDFKKTNNVRRALYIAVGDLVLLTRRTHDGGLHVSTLSGSRGRPIAGAKVWLYRRDYNKGHRAVRAAVSGADGVVRFSHAGGSFFVLAQKGAHVALDRRFISLYRPGRPVRSYAALVYTDRAIYRPQQTIHFKTVVYRGRSDRADYKVAPRTPLTVRLTDANHQEVAKTKLTTNAYGTASGSFVIPSGRLLGRWQVRVSRGGSAVVRVEEYKRPTFEAKLIDPKAPLRLNKPAALVGQARYLFGLPVTSGKVKWRVTRAPVYPWWWHHGWWGRGGGAARTQTIDAGTTELSETGAFTVRFTPRADERLGAKDAGGAAAMSGVSYRYAVTAVVTDEGGESRTATRTFRLGFVAVQAGIDLGKSFLLEGQAGELTIRRTNLDGVASPGRGRYRLVRLKMPARARLPADRPLPAPPRVAPRAKRSKQPFRTRGDARRQRWSPGYSQRAVLRGWRDGAEKARGSLTHDDKGNAEVKLPRLVAGAYRLHYTTRDAFGAEYRLSKSFIVASAKPRLALPAYLLVEQASVKVGQTARLLVGSGLPGQRLAVDFYRAGKHTERRVLESGQDSALIEIPITEAHRGGFGVTLTALRDHQLLQFQRPVFVPWDNKELEVSFSTFRDRLRPGVKEKWTVKVTGPGGEKTPVRAAEVLAYMYDRSLDTFAPHQVPRPVSIFPGRTASVWARATLGTAQQSTLPYSGFAALPHYPPLRDDALRFLSSYGIGGPGKGNRYNGHGRYALRFSTSADAPAASPRPRRLAAKKEKSGARGAYEDRRQPAAKMPQGSAAAADEPRAPAPAPGVQVRKNFSETAFFRPHLLTGADGSVSFEFSVPDSVTSWNVWAHAITRDLQSGSIKRDSRTVKELMVRAYLPRFLREDDRAAIKVVVNNASDKPINGKLSFDIIDPSTQKSVLSTFGLTRKQASNRAISVRPGGGSNVTFPIKTPAKVGLVAFKVIARSKTFSDGELRPLPVLPGRMHLAQSRFVTLKDKTRRELHFADLKRPDPTRINEQMVVTIDAQLFYSVLGALPYLVNYPYECTEQTLNRFLSTGILASMYKDYPAIERMAKSFSRRETRLERFDGGDPNRKMALEETPWLQAAQGGASRSAHPLINVLDPRITRAQRDASLAKLKKAQTSLGGFPWFPGGPPSPYMTLYILHGFSKGLEFGVDVPKPVIQRAWRYLHRHYIDEIVANMQRRDCCWEFITFLNYVLSNYPDASWTGGVFSERERDKMLSFSFRHWKSHSPYLKAYLALTLHRKGRRKDARLVWDSVMDSAKTERGQGTFWAPEARSWLWYNDTIETHAFAVRTVMELLPASQNCGPDGAGGGCNKSTPTLDGLVLWLFLNKKLNHWKSTRATSEVIYSLAHYLKRTAQLGVKESITVTAGDLVRRFDFSPERYTGKKNQIVIPGPQIDPRKHATIVVAKQTKGFAFASATWHFSTEQLPKEPKGDYLRVSRRYFKRVKTARETKLIPLSEGTKLKVGDEVEVQLSLKTKHPMEYVHLRDPRPAGFEPVSFTSKHKWNLGIYWYEEIRDSGTNFFFERLPHGEYPFKYRLRATMAGTFKASPATVQPMYAPEFTGYSSGRTISIR